MTIPRLFADFQNADSQGRVRLNCAGTLRDLGEQRVILKPGLEVVLYGDDANNAGEDTELQAHGVVEYSNFEAGWVAAIDWTKVDTVKDNLHSDANSAAAKSTHKLG